jgi:hypothetical protein
MIGLVGEFLVMVRQWVRRHAVRAIDPFGEILKLAALAAEREPVRVRTLAAAKHAQTRSHGDILLEVYDGA